jgi:hypothetical protein
MPFPVDMPDKTPCALSEDFYQEKLPLKPLLGHEFHRSRKEVRQQQWSLAK